MTESMKFGPEWLRNMSSDIGGGGGQGGQSGGGISNVFGQNNNNTINSGNNNNSTSNMSANKYQLAEYRYGREEMLLLCDKARIPEILPKYKKLFVEKINCPLALTPSTDDDVVTYERTPWVVRGAPPTIGISSRGGRGGSIDRGRGRGRGSYHSTLGYQRSTSMYDEDARGVGRPPWLERNGTDPSEWNGGSSTSPRKEYITRNPSVESWRRTRDDDSTATTSTSTTTIASDTWRGGLGPSGAAANYKWGRSQSWRDEEATMGHNNSAFNSSNISDRSLIGPVGKSSLAGTAVRKSLHTWNDEEKLPEWASEDPIEGGGSFDASGAFHGTLEDDDTQSTDSNVKSNRKPSVRTDDSNHTKKESSLEPVPISKPKSNHPQIQEKSENKDNIAVADDKKVVPTSESDRKRASQVEQNDNVNNQNKKIDGVSEDANKENSSATGNMAIDAKKELIMSNISQVQTMNSEVATPNIVNDDMENQKQFLKIQSMLQSQHKQNKLSRPPMSESASVDRMQEVADDMVKNLISDDEISSNERDISTSSAQLLRKKSDNMPPHQLYKESQYAPAQSDQWLYEDPQGKIQGPFTATEMTEWYRAGYFDENLMVRQVFEARYSALGELVKQRGSLPFGTSAPLPHTMKNDLSTSHVSHEIPLSNIPQVKPTANPVQMLPEFQFLQQKALLMKLAEDPWSLMSAEQQAANKGMVDINDYLLPPSPMTKQSQSLGIPPNLTHPKHPILKQPLPANQQNMFNNHDFIASNTASPTDQSSALNRLMQQMSINQHQTPLTIPMQHQPPPQPSSQNQYDAIQSLMMQLAMQKVPSSGHVTMPNTNQNPIDKNSPNNGGWMGTNIGVAHQPNLGPSSNAAASSWGTNRIWPIQMPQMGANALKLPPTINQQQQMKTEKQIRDELKKEDPKKDELINWKISNLAAQQQAQHQHMQQQVAHQQQQQLLENQIIEKQREEKRKRDADSEKRNKAEEEKQKQSKKDALKSDGSSSKKDPKSDDKKRDSDEKKRLKELKRQQAEDERRRQQEEEKRRQNMEEQKRLDDIAEQRKAKLMEGQRRSQQHDQSLPRQNANPSVAPWSINPVAQVVKPSLSLAEIQKAERERRAEQSRIEQLIREQQQTQNLIESRQQKESTQKWNLQPHSVKSLAEIQAEESVKRQSISDQIALNSIAAAANASAKKRDADQAQQHLASIWNSNTTNTPPMWNATAAKMWSNGSSISGGGFWEEPNKTNVRMSNSISNMSGGNIGSSASKTLVKSQTVSNMQQAAAKSTSKLQANAAKPIAKTNSSAAVSTSGLKPGKSGKKDREASENSNQEFNVWCFKALASHENAIDVPTFVSFLRDLESPFEVKDYIRMYLGETKECTEFAKQFLERRSKYKNQQRAANAHIDDMCSPAPAITPSSDFQEVKGKGKKEKKKNKMLKLDSRILGFSVTAAQDRLNVGDRDYSYGDAP